ncbi:hypothetical protein HYDPIDRAFT_28699 [Hydnomerulius pinastri MD-312]|uniref:RING-CH-type domain-containing protein n=1 Tax=Hydnomerulius pinastri MD-312 TaxID=994086 RepID=A0A0C9W999_9AGAM|nr:hypothetical protein HYDPIDRAFT_28699 [Hydnomerulius pinastri MD-312]
MEQRRVPTINDLRVKLCYICREEERYDAPPLRPPHTSRTPPAPESPPRTWTHPCTCTLIAHESCLLRWIASSQSTRSRAPHALKCPQCGVGYELTSWKPWALRVLDAGNWGAGVLGRCVGVGSLTVLVVGFGTGMYILSTAYGAYALREFLGNEMFDLLLTDDPTNWPWHSFINLPLIPLALIVSRLPLKSPMAPLVPVLLAWPTSAPVRAPGEPYAIDTVGGGRKDVFPLLPQWPPPPLVLGLFVFPMVRETYKRVFSQFSRWVLDSGHGGAAGEGQGGRGEREREEMHRALMGALNDDEPFLRIRVNANIDEDDDDPPPAPVPRPNPANPNPNPNPANAANAQGEDGPDAAAAAAAAENTIRVSGTSIGRLIGGALIIPRISSFMGNLLLRLSKHSVVLRKLLAVRPPLRARGVPASLFASGARVGGVGGVGGAAALMLPPALFGGKSWAEMGALRRMGVVGVMGLSAVWRGSYMWAECDPVWWRNSLGLGLFSVAKDCLHLLHLYLTKRELESRRVKNRSFEGVDVRELDLIDPRAYS